MSRFACIRAGLAFVYLIARNGILTMQIHRLLSCALPLFLIVAGCRPAPKSVRSVSSNTPSPLAISTLDPMAIVLSAHAGGTPLDADIRRAQQEIPGSANATPALERLGWLFVSKARVSFDPGFYKLAEQCAVAIEVRAPGSLEALLLRGHVLQNLHRFHDAEPLARRLVAERGSPFDFGLLGDVLMEQGRLAEAIAAYQRMADLNPDSQALARIAHVRALKGDLAGALQACRQATAAVNARDAEVAAWMHTRLGGYEFQAGHFEAARAACATALTLQTNYPPALLLCGRILLAETNGIGAIEPLRLAAGLNPLPEYQWAFAEALRQAGRAAEADQVEGRLLNTGASEDARTFSLFLATRRLQPSTSCELARRELLQRVDVHTHDALAWALAADHQWDEAAKESALALAEGTADARLLFHAAWIAAHRGDAASAGPLTEKANRFRQMLLPSERAKLFEVERMLASVTASGPSAVVNNK